MHLAWYALSHCTFPASKNDQGQITACPHKTMVEDKAVPGYIFDPFNQWFFNDVFIAYFYMFFVSVLGPQSTFFNNARITYFLYAWDVSYTN